MSSPLKPPALLPAGRSRWIWLGVALALGLWLLVMLLLPGREQTQAESGEAAPRNPTFDSPAANLFTNRRPAKSSRPLPSFPVVTDERKSE